MSRENNLTDLLGIQGWKVKKEEIEIGDKEVVIPIERLPGEGYQCSRCGEKYFFYYDRMPKRKVRDFPICGRKCYLEFRSVRVECSNCREVVVEKLDWIEPFQRLTLRYEKYIARLCEILPVKDVSELEGLNKDTVYRVDRKWLKIRCEKREMRTVRYLGIDEISIKKGHKYATMFYDLERREVIGMVKGRKQRKVSSFFRKWGKEKCKRVEAICMDLWSAYLNSVRIYCKKAVVVFDKFHIYSYLNTAIDKVRRNEQNKADEEGKKLIKGSRWLWLKNPQNTKRRENQRLKDIMDVNENLQAAYLLKEDFERFYEQEDRNGAEEFLNEWTNRCRESELKPFCDLAKRLNRWKHGILAYFEYKITNSVAEGINNKIKVLKRRSYGFHDLEYFFMKILCITGSLPQIDVLTHNF